ncbi:glycoside hydrolase family 6 protein [Kineococcus rubinsiae]|uniref:glycoside hydrolase family 6 protein n=1 Tax=Kineococcus rubinsiae TaxID=2609562 RepID=UPI00143006C5|nr:glycoside hydrolase family 6 protein [Kineococcus rubinsiae]NIZ90343.1 glycoside hydrolase family 6 protein [Kineococcus rubinsiae]
MDAPLSTATRHGRHLGRRRLGRSLGRRPERSGKVTGLAVLALAVSVLGLLLSGCSPDRSTLGAASPLNPLTGAVFHVNPQGHASAQLTQWENDGEREKAFWLRRLAEQPVATWLTGAEADLDGDVTRLTFAAAAAGEVPVLVAYNIPGRDCGSYSAGGAATTEDYTRWIDTLAQGIADREVVVILEPDAVIHTLDGCASAAGHDPQERYVLLKAAVERLKQNPGTTVYLDGGNAGWITDEGAVAQALRAAGVQAGDGFALNVSNFKTTADSTTYGRGISRLLNDAHFVIDTSRNGSGPAPADGQGIEWCNPTHRTLGQAPTADTGDALIDAYLWIKVPGDSDGACRPGEPPAGTWWPDYALNLTMQTLMGHPFVGH